MFQSLRYLLAINQTNKYGVYTIDIVLSDEDGDKAYKDFELTVFEQSETGRYDVVPDYDSAYTVDVTLAGIVTLMMNQETSGFRFFNVTIQPVISNEGNETVVFVLTRDEVQIGFSAVSADFDVESSAIIGFNVQGGDIIKVYIVNDLSNSGSSSPVLLQ